MSGTADKIDQLVAQGRIALEEDDAFEAERLLLKALGLARQAGDFERLADICRPLWSARRIRLQAAIDIGAIHSVDGRVTEETEVEAGCYLIEPPQVGADARRLRLAALEAEIPVAVVCREPRTQLGLCPVVAICPGTTVRTKIDPPPDPENPDLEWFTWAMEELGDWAISTLDPEMEITRRVDALINMLNAVPDHHGLHLALEDAARIAADAPSPPPSRRRQQTPSS